MGISTRQYLSAMPEPPLSMQSGPAGMVSEAEACKPNRNRTACDGLIRHGVGSISQETPARMNKRDTRPNLPSERHSEMMSEDSKFALGY